MTTAHCSHANRVLIESLAPDSLPAADLKPSEWEQLWTSARDHCLVPYLHKVWTDSGFLASLPPALAERFSHARANNFERNRKLLFALDELSSALKKKGIPILLSKGFPVAKICYGDLGLRLMYDIDLLIKGHDHARAVDVLRSIGYKPFFENRGANLEGTLFWQPKEYIWDAEKVFDPEQPCFVELHTRPWEPRWHGFRLECNLDLWKGARVQEIAGVSLQVPVDENLLVHLAVHYACNVLESSARLMHLLDIALLLRLRATRLDWDVILENIRESRAAPFTYIAFCLAERVGGSKIPEGVRGTLEKATPRGIMGWLALRGPEDAVSMSVRQRDRSLIYFLHWKMAAGWREKISVLLHSLRGPWLEATGAGRWKSVFRRVVQRLRHLAGAPHA